jgi:hypothetical protein
MGHVQHLDSSGLKVPSVSQIPGIFVHDMSGFEDWICRQEHGKDDRCCTAAKRKFYEEAAHLGNDIHQLREAFLRGESFEEGVPEYQAKVFAPVAQFYKESGYKPLPILNYDHYVDGIELKMTGKEFGGTLDGAGTFSNLDFLKKRGFWQSGTDFKFDFPTVNDVWVDDLKIKSKLDVLHPLQLYGYSLLLKECHGVEAKWGLIIRREKKLDKSPEIQLKGYYLPAYRAQWEASMLMWKFLNA